MRKILINRCFGGYTLSDKFKIKLCKIKNRECDKLYFYSGGYDEDYNDTFEFIRDFKFKENGDLIVENQRPSWNMIYVTYEYQGKNPEELMNCVFLSDELYARDDKDLIKLFEEMGSKKASGRYASLKIVEIPEDVEWEISDYDGLEEVHEKHRVWC